MAVEATSAGDYYGWSVVLSEVFYERAAGDDPKTTRLVITICILAVIILLFFAWVGKTTWTHYFIVNVLGIDSIIDQEIDTRNASLTKTLSTLRTGTFIRTFVFDDKALPSKITQNLIYRATDQDHADLHLVASVWPYPKTGAEARVRATIWFDGGPQHQLVEIPLENADTIPIPGGTHPSVEFAPDSHTISIAIGPHPGQNDVSIDAVVIVMEPQ